MSTYSTPIDNRDISVKKTKSCSSCYYQVPGDKLPFYYSKPTSDINFLNDQNIHLWTSLGIYRLTDAELYNTPYTSGGYKNTSYDQLYEAYTSTGFYTISIDDTMFRMALEPRVRMSLPITGATHPSLSALTSVTLYSGLLKQDNSLTPISSGPSALVTADVVKSEYHISASDTGIGQKRIAGVNPGASEVDDPSTNYYDSGIMLLWSDDIDYSGATTGTTWGTSWSASTKYTYSNARLGVFNGVGTTGTNGYNQAVGAIDLYSGNAYIWHPEIVPYINTGIATGGTVTTGLTFNTTDCNFIIKDYDTTMSAKVNIVLQPNQYTTTTNPSMAEAVKADADCDKQVYFDQVCFMDGEGRPVAYASLSDTIVKPKDEFVSLAVEFTIDGGVGAEVWDTYSLPTYGC